MGADAGNYAFGALGLILYSPREAAGFRRLRPIAVPFKAWLPEQERSYGQANQKGSISVQGLIFLCLRPYLLCSHFQAH